jgi:alkaline phosphatase D
MRRVLVMAALVTFAGAVTALEAQGVSPGERFQYGVAAGDVRANSALLWTRAPSAGRVRLVVSTTKTFRPVVASGGAQALAEDDLTVVIRATRLLPGTRYWYRFLQEDKGSPPGMFKTAPRPTSDVKVRFAFSGDADATPGANDQPVFNRFQVYARMATEQNDFNINLGDTIYSDSEIGGAPVARTVPEKWAKYRLGLALPALRQLRGSAGLYSHWDDHEFINDFSPAENGSAIYAAGVKAFRDYAPVAKPSANGLYRTFRWGKHLELFFLDERSFRSAKATTVCGSDLAPTAPQAVRDAFSSLAPGLKNPVPTACLAAIDDSARTMLGTSQYTAFTKAIEASKATWKVIVNEVPIQQFYALPYDRWEGYAVERERLLRFLQANVRNVVFLTTDTHANFVNEVRYRTLGGPPEGSGIWEVVTGPVATNTFAKEIDGFLGTPGAGTAIGALFFKPPPPNGMGMRCAALDTYSYSQVTVTANTLTVAMKDARGRAVREATGVSCAPLVLRAS